MGVQYIDKVCYPCSDKIDSTKSPSSLMVDVRRALLVGDITRDQLLNRNIGNIYLSDIAERGGKVIMAANAFERVRDIIVEQLGVDPEDVTMEANFRDDLEADSLDLVELIMQFEEEFGGEISDEEAQKIVTVGDAVKFLDT